MEVELRSRLLQEFFFFFFCIMLHVGHTANTVSVLASWLVTLGKAWLCLTSKMRPVLACHGVLIRIECLHTCSAIHMMSAVYTAQHSICKACLSARSVGVSLVYLHTCKSSRVTYEYLLAKYWQKKESGPPFKILYSMFRTKELFSVQIQQHLCSSESLRMGK